MPRRQTLGRWRRPARCNGQLFGLGCGSCPWDRSPWISVIMAARQSQVCWNLERAAKMCFLSGLQGCGTRDEFKRSGGRSGAQKLVADCPIAHMPGAGWCCGCCGVDTTEAGTGGRSSGHSREMYSCWTHASLKAEVHSSRPYQRERTCTHGTCDLQVGVQGTAGEPM